MIRLPVLLLVMTTPVWANTPQQILDNLVQKAR